MKRSLNPQLLSLFTLGAGGLGLVLRIWYFSTRDAKGLLAASHFANTVSYLVFAAALALIFLCVRQLPNEGRYASCFRSGIVPAAGCVIGAVGIVCTCLFDVFSKVSISGLSLIVGIPAAICLVLIGMIRLKAGRPSVVLYAILALYFVVHILLQIRQWNPETQQTVIFFPLLAALFLMVCTYFHAHMTVRQENARSLVFFQQAALLLCCFSINGANGLFYLTMAAWLGCDLCIPRRSTRREEV